MMKPKFCAECKYSKPETNSPWNLRCVNPYVNANDSWALSSSTIHGTTCSTERDKRFFAACGMKGKLWEQK